MFVPIKLVGRVKRFNNIKPSAERGGLICAIGLGISMRIAVLDDDKSQTDLVSQALTAIGHHVHAYEKGKVLIHDLHQESFDLLILDWHVPDLSGTEVLRWVRSHEKQHVPVLFVTLRSAEDDIITALNAGADDYMIKPLRRGELLARTQALLRRAYPEPAVTDHIKFGNYVFDSGRCIVVTPKEEITLTQKEFNLSLLLFRHLGRPLSRGHILESVWGREIDIPSRSMDTHISRIRTKLNLRPDNGYRLAPVYSYGYRLEDVQQESITEPHAA